MKSLTYRPKPGREDSDAAAAVLVLEASTVLHQARQFRTIKLPLYNFIVPYVLQTISLIFLCIPMDFAYFPIDCRSLFQLYGMVK